jgi:hypothetical protein
VKRNLLFAATVLLSCGPLALAVPITPFAAEARALGHGQSQTRAIADPLAPPAVSFLANGPLPAEARYRGIDRSLILRSFDPRLRRPDPFRAPQRVNVRTPLKW